MKRLLLLLAAALFGSAAQAGDKIEFNRDIRPILAETCFNCHGPDSAARKADLRLDRREDAVKAGAIVPGEPAKSALVERIHSTVKAEMMPPAKTNKTLTAAQKDLLKRWIADGAEYQSHWAFLAPVRPPVPTVKTPGWVRNPVDAFVLAALEKRGLQPTAEADRHTLARRLSLDLIGLPPTPAEVEAFVKDAAPDAYERYVERLFKSPHWGEHRARTWLDAARYADTHGIHHDNFREVSSYRDWVIGAFNKNMPFDRFTIEQLAGDLLPNRTLDQQVATGFNRCNITTNEGGAINEEYLVLYTRDRTETTSAVWLGLTANCCTCHDHKYDPISQKEFYSLSAFFNNTTQGAMDGNIPNTPPTIFVPRREDRPRWEAVHGEIIKTKALLEARKTEGRKEFDAWLASTKAADLAKLFPTAGLKLHVPFNEGQGEQYSAVVDGKPRTVEAKDAYSWVAGTGSSKAAALKPTGAALTLEDAGDFEKDQPFAASAWVKTASPDNTGAIVARMDNTAAFRGWDFWMEKNRIGTHIISQWPGDALKVTSKMALAPNQWYHVAVSYDGSGKAAGVRVSINGAPQAVDVFTDKLKSTIRTPVPLKIGQRHTIERLKNVALQDVRLYGRALNQTEVEQLARSPRAQELLTLPAAQRSAKDVAELYDWWLAGVDAKSQELHATVARLTQEEAALRARGMAAHVMQERNEEPTAFVLFRGDYDKRRDKVQADTPAMLPPLPKDLPRNRLGFAQWLLRPEHPLTARVTVNRFWQELFGTGIVRTANDFGIAGELPSHPELLDWLAVDFRESGWDIQRLFKLLVTSAAYREAATVTKDRLEKDPQNRYLSHGPRYRLDAEVIRDYALAASGLLVPKVGGPSVRPYQPEGVWEAVAMIGSDTRNYRRDNGENLYRRSMYTFWKRAAPPASMDILNAPNRETCAVRRERTNTPLQALVTLNDPQFVEAARALAQVSLKEGDTPEKRANVMANRLLARALRADEMQVVQTGVAKLLTFYQAHPEDARKLITVGESRPDASLDVPTLAAWTMLANEMMNLDEVLNK